MLISYLSCPYHFNRFIFISIFVDNKYYCNCKRLWNEQWLLRIIPQNYQVNLQKNTILNDITYNVQISLECKPPPTLLDLYLKLFVDVTIMNFDNT